MSNFAKVSWNSDLNRYELIIENTLKAYSEGNNEDEHEIGRDELVKMAEGKGYTVHVNKK